MGSNDEMIHFSNWREKWQHHKEKEFQVMLQEVEQIAQRLISFREKMRALYLFQQWTGYQRTKESTADILPEQIFQQWFLYDYLNVKQERMVEFVLKEAKLHHYWEYASNLIASYYSLYQVQKKGQTVRLISLLEDKPAWSMEGSGMDGLETERTYYALMRPVKVGVKLFPFKPVVFLTKEQAQKMQAWSYEKRKAQTIPMRIWMKGEGLGMFRFIFEKNHWRVSDG